MAVAVMFLTPSANPHPRLRVRPLFGGREFCPSPKRLLDNLPLFVTFVPWIRHVRTGLTANCGRIPVSPLDHAMNSESHTSRPQRPVTDWLRWLAVLPAALGAYFGIQLVIGLARGLEDGFADRPDYKSQLICSILGPYFLVWVGAKTAPRFRFVTALTLTVLHAIAAGSLVTIGIVQGLLQSGALWWLIICSVVGFVGTIVLCVQMRKGDDTT